MKHPERVEDYLEHIAEAIDRATLYLAPLGTLDALLQDKKTQDAIVRNIEIIGEATRQIQQMAPDYFAQHPDIPWKQMRAMRNVVIHEYFFVDWQIVWDAVKTDLPPLRKQLQSLLEARREQGPEQEQDQGLRR